MIICLCAVNKCMHNDFACGTMYAKNCMHAAEEQALAANQYHSLLTPYTVGFTVMSIHTAGCMASHTNFTGIQCLSTQLTTYSIYKLVSLVRFYIMPHSCSSVQFGYIYNRLGKLSSSNIAGTGRFHTHYRTFWPRGSLSTVYSLVCCSFGW